MGEAELLIWESGEAEMAPVSQTGEVQEEHLAFTTASSIGYALARMLAWVTMSTDKA